MKFIIVVPTIREQCIKAFLHRWKDIFRSRAIIVVEDNPKKTFSLDIEHHYSWEDIDKELQNKAWIIPRRTDCIRSFGFLKAHKLGADVIITLDDDCYPQNSDFIKIHYYNLEIGVMSLAWLSTIRKVKPRGYPFINIDRENECVVSHGLWLHHPDLDAITQLANTELYEGASQVISKGKYYPMCGMNLAFKAKILPMMYFLLMGRDYKYDRFGDIWCGIFSKKICDHLNLGVMSGLPYVVHQKASNLWANLEKEAPAYRINESLWQRVDQIILTKETPKECYIELAEKLPIQGEYWDKLREAMKIWGNLF